MSRTLITLFLFIVGAHSLQAVEQRSIPRIDQMPDQPSGPLRDWKQVARDYDTLAFDFGRTGEDLPLIWWDRTHVNLPLDTFGLPAYVGHPIQNGGNHYDVITCLGALLGASLSGIDKTNQQGHNWVAMAAQWFNSANGLNLYLNNNPGSTGQTFWYELFPNLLFFRIADRHRAIAPFEPQMRAVAEQMLRMTQALAGADADLTTAVPNFDHTSFNMATMQAVDNGVWKEPDGAAAVAWLLYSAYARFGDERYLTGARACLRYLDQRTKNPFYEILQPYGALVSARMNAELGDRHDSAKQLGWVFDGTNARRWGIAAGKWGELDASGLLSSVIEQQGYAFAMNTFDTVSVLAPVIRYEPRHAEALSKWIALVAHNSRLFYPNGLPPTQQTCYDWAVKHDPQFCLAYEGLREEGLKRCRAEAETTAAGTVGQGDYHATFGQDGNAQVLKPDARGRLEHRWQMTIPPGHDPVLVLIAEVKLPAGATAAPLEVGLAPDMQSTATRLLTLNPGNSTHWCELQRTSETLALVVSGTLPAGAELRVDDLYVQLPLGIKPMAMGDPKFMGWARSDLGLYGSSFVGCLAAVVEPTNVPGIVQVDTVRTDAWAPRTYPTFAYFNPHATTQTLELPMGEAALDLYDAIEHAFIAQGVTGTARVAIGPGQTRLLVHCPPSGTLAHDAWRTTLNGVVIDYANGRVPRPEPAPVAPPPDHSRVLRVPKASTAPTLEGAWPAGDTASIELDTAPVGTMKAQLSFAWDEHYLYARLIEVAGAKQSVEATEASAYQAGPFAYDGLALFFDWDNSNDGAPQGDYNVWLGLNSRGDAQLITARPPSTERTTRAACPNSVVETAGTAAQGNRRILARIAWSDIERNLPYYARGERLPPIAGQRFGLEPLLLDGGYKGQQFIGGGTMPTGDDARSLDLILE